MPQSVPTHRPLWQPTKQERDRYYGRLRRGKDNRAFYHTAAWLGARLLKLTTNPYCELCLQRGMYVPATHVHHIIEIDTDSSMALDIENMQSLCISCHSKVHAINGVGRSNKS